MWRPAAICYTLTHIQLMCKYKFYCILNAGLKDASRYKPAFNYNQRVFLFVIMILSYHFRAKNTIHWPCSLLSLFSLCSACVHVFDDEFMAFDCPLCPSCFNAIFIRFLLRTLFNASFNRDHMRI